MRIYCCIIVLLIALCIREISLLPDGNLHAHVLDVGQGDSIFIVTPNGKQILVDGGPDLTTLSALRKHMSFFDRTLDLVVATHFDADHIGALPEVLRRYRTDAVMMHATGAPDALHYAVDSAVIHPDPSVDLLLDDVVFDIVWPPPHYEGSKNNGSIVLRVIHNDQSILLAGDVEVSAEAHILATGADIESDILKVPHHGSRTSSSTGFLLAVGPDLAIVSAGRNNPYGHPHADVMSRYRALGIETKTTPEYGVVSSVLYGVNY